MARPLKEGLEYFPHDVAFHQDVRIRKLMKRYGGIAASGIYSIFLERIYEKGYYIDFKDDDFFIIAETAYVEEDFVSQVLEGCLALGLFDRQTYDASGVLTSKAIQARYLKIQKTLQHTIKVTKYNLLSPVKADEKCVTTVETGGIFGKNVDKSMETPPLTIVSTEKLAQKKIKGKGKVEEEEKPENTVHSFIHSGKAMDDEEESFGFEEGIEILKKDSDWLSKLGDFFHIDDEKTQQLLEKFVAFCRLQDNTAHRDYQTLQEHFKKWADSELKNNRELFKKKSEPQPKSANPSAESLTYYPDDDPDLYHQFLNYFRRTFPLIAHMTLERSEYERMHTLFSREWVKWALSMVENDPYMNRKLRLLPTLQELKDRNLKTDPTYQKPDSRTPSQKLKDRSCIGVVIDDTHAPGRYDNE